MSPARRWIAAGLIALLLPVSALATVCAAWCEGAPVAVDAIAQAADTPSPDAGGTPCAAASLCAFAVTPAVPGHAISVAVAPRANVAPDDPGARSVPAEPSPPPEPPARLAPTA